MRPGLRDLRDMMDRAKRGDPLLNLSIGDLADEVIRDAPVGMPAPAIPRIVAPIRTAPIPLPQTIREPIPRIRRFDGMNPITLPVIIPEEEVRSLPVQAFNRPAPRVPIAQELGPCPPGFERR